jgi:hypothetical protein
MRACTATGLRSPPPDAGILRRVRRRAALALGLVAVAALPATASAAVTMTDFKVEPASTQGGGHPDVTITQTFDYGSSTTDSVKDAFVRLQPGLLGNPQSAAMCTQQQFEADDCPSDSVVGSVEVTAKAYILVLPLTLTNSGVVYNLRPTGDEPARVGIVVEAAGGLSKIFLQAPVFIRPGADGYGLESTFADQPRDSGGIPIQILKVALTFNGQAAKGTFMRMPTSCAEGTSLSRANSWEEPTAFSEKTFATTPTGCDSLGFAPKASGFMGSPSATKKDAIPPVGTTLTFDPEEAALKRAEVTLPNVLAPSIAVLLRVCSRADSDASNCPDSSRVGTAIIDSPLQPQPVRGPVYIAYNSDNQLPGLVVILPPPVGVRLDGLVDLSIAGSRNTFASNPDLPVRSFTLNIDGDRPDGLLRLAKDLCADDTDRTMTVHLVAHNGKESTFEQELATPGCDPTAKVTIRRKGRRATLVARLRAARVGPGITQFALTLPKTLSRGKSRPVVFADGARMRPATSKRRASMPFPHEVRTATLVWRGLKTGRRLRKTAVISLRMTDGRPHVTTLKQKVRVRGKAPRKKRR